MKLGPVPKLEKEKYDHVKKIGPSRHGHKLLRHCLFSNYGQFAAIRKPDFRDMVYKIFILHFH